MHSLLNGAANIVNHTLKSISPALDLNSRLKDYSPVAILGTTTIALLAMQQLFKCTQAGWNESRFEQFGRLLLNLPYVKKKYHADINREYQHALKSTLEKWKIFGEPFRQMPEKGLSTTQLIDLVKKYSEITFQKLHGKQISGAVYSNNFIKKNEWVPEFDNDDKIDIFQLSDKEYFSKLAEKLKLLHTYSAYMSDLWNSLHQDEFAIGNFLDYQIVRMVADMFGGAPSEVMGLVTTGGTDSLMTAARIYRNWGMETHGHAPGEGVIVAGKSVHAAILKSGVSSLLKVVLVDVDEQGIIDLSQLQSQLTKYGNKVVMIVGSAPSYATGTIDLIQELARMAYDHGCGMHVDSCLGGFIVNHLEQHNTQYLQMKGVTSLSCDTHKNGQAPKGSSVLVLKALGGVNLARHSVYCNPEWDGGVYGTPSDEGSKSCTASLNAFLSMLAIGKQGYQRIANRIHEQARKFAEMIGNFEELQVLKQPDVNVIALKINSKANLGKGAIYAFAHEMANRGFIFNTMPHERIHFCITLRYVCDLEVSERLKNAIKDSLEAVKKLDQQLKQNGCSFPGNASMYCSLENALEPKTSNLSTIKFIENAIMGIRGASEAVRAHYLALFDPYQTTSIYE